MAKMEVTPAPKQRNVGVFKQTFHELATTWKYQGFPMGITFEFVKPEYDAFFVQTARSLLARDVETAEGFFMAVLKRAYIPGVVEYTLDGGYNGYGRKRTVGSDEAA